MLHLRRTCRLRDYCRQCPTPSPSWGCCKSPGSSARPRILMGAGILGLGGWPMGLGRRPLGTAAAATRTLGCARNRYSLASRALALAADPLSALGRIRSLRTRTMNIETRKHRHKQQSATIDVPAIMLAAVNRCVRQAGNAKPSSSARAGRR